MATSSIIDNIRVNNPQVLVDYVDFLEAQAKEPVKKEKIEKIEKNYELLTDPERIMAIVRKNLENRGMQL